MTESDVWVFNGRGGRFPSGVFATRGAAEEWISKHQLSGTLTRYPVGIGVYDWAIANGQFKPKKPEHRQAEFIGKFTSAGMEHYHFDDEE